MEQQNSAGEVYGGFAAVYSQFHINVHKYEFNHTLELSNEGCYTTKVLNITACATVSLKNVHKYI